MKRKLFLAASTFMCFSILLKAQQKNTNASSSITGDWLLTIDYYGNPMQQAISLKQEGTIVSGKFINDDSAKLIVTMKGNMLHMLNPQSDSSSTVYDGVFLANEGSGKVIMYDPLVKDSIITKWVATRLVTTRPTLSQRINFTPTQFQRGFSAYVPPVLHIWPADTVHTESVDAGGYDKLGIRRVMGGNPLTGPFYIETALPGDVVAITITRLRLNRNWAISDEQLVNRAMTNDYAKKVKDSYETVKWKLDMEKGTATPAKPHEHMKNYVVPVKPMLGCVGLAPWFGSQSIGTGDSGPFGGNMDFNSICEGATVYLPVMHAGALLYIGDAHALEGDGELTGDALETSMDIEFTVKVLKGTDANASMPRVEDANYIMAVGLSGSLDNAFRDATSELANWLEHDYKLSPQETAQVLGTAIEYHICEVADRNVGVVAKIKKVRLKDLKQ
ncbi:MAG: acetamidase/formamidase family protein [Chitinophagales bacterium]